MSTLVVEGILTGNAPMAAYGGIQLDESVLHDLVEQLLSGELPMVFQHDPRHPLQVKILEAEVRLRPDGYKDVWFSFEVDKEEWHTYAAEIAKSGGPGGFSFSMSEPLGIVEAFDDTKSGNLVQLDADASHWSDEDLLAAAEDLRRVGTVRVGRRYEFAVDPTSVVVFAVLLPLAVGVAAAAIYDGLKRFLRPERRTIFHFRVGRVDGTVEGYLETSDPEVLRRGIEAMEELGRPGHRFEWDDESTSWRSLDP